MIRRVLSGVVAGLFLLAAAGPAASQAKKDPKEIEEIEVFQLLKCEEKETIYLAAGGGGRTEKRHNYQIAAKPVYANEVKNVVLAQEKNTNEKDMTNLKDQIADLRTAMKHWQASMDSVIAAIESQDKAPSSGTGLVAASFLAPPEDSAAGSGMTTRELSDLRTMTRQLKNALTPLEEISKTLSAYKDLMANTPTYWPLKGAHGQITTPFGWTTEPFTKVGYMHTGVDISTGVVGTPVVATADGKVTQRGETAQLGLNITIQHKYGFYTRYGHLSGFAGRQKGDDVHRGDVIGYLGNTGLSTGPHLHYEVRLGAMYIDPMQYLLNMPANAPAVASRRIVD